MLPKESSAQMRRRVRTTPLRAAVNQAALFVLLYGGLIVAPYVLVYLYREFLPKLIEPFLAKPLGGEELSYATFAIVVVAFSFHWLKLKHQTVYGAIEIFVAQFTIATAIVRLGDREAQAVVTLLQIFTGIYITIRGLDNVEKGLKSSSSPSAIELWNDTFAPDIVGTKLLYNVLMAASFLALSYSTVAFFVSFCAVSFAESLITLHIKSKRPFRRRDQGIKEGTLVEVMSGGLRDAARGKTIVATSRVFAQMEAALPHVWDQYVIDLRTSVTPRDEVFSTDVGGKTVLVIEDAAAVTFMYPHEHKVATLVS